MQWCRGMMPTLVNGGSLLIPAVFEDLHGAFAESSGRHVSHLTIDVQSLCRPEPRRPIWRSAQVFCAKIKRAVPRDRGRSCSTNAKDRLTGVKVQGSQCGLPNGSLTRRGRRAESLTCILAVRVAHQLQRSTNVAFDHTLERGRTGRSVEVKLDDERPMLESNGLSRVAATAVGNSRLERGISIQLTAYCLLRATAASWPSTAASTPPAPRLVRCSPATMLYRSLFFYLSLVAAASTPDTKPPEPCTIRSPTSHNFYDLNPLHIPDPAQSKAKHPRETSWNATGYDQGYNFTLNICGSVIEDVKDVAGVPERLWANVSAYYKQNGEVFSIGQQNSAPILRGRKLVLNYTDGSPCDPNSVKRSHAVEDLYRRKITDDDDDDEDGGVPSRKPSDNIRRKSTIISFLCEKDPLMPTLTLSFVSASPDECSYFFEARSSAACLTIETAKQTLSPSGVFGVIVLIAVIVYIVGGCVYSRMVLNQRGWKQLPNYGLWAGLFGFFRDIFVILTSSCARLLPSRRGYSRVNGSLGHGSGRGRGRGESSDAENRLIDELNEEWDD
nr:putative mannose 6-phosphate receptor-like protein [Quercus suber]